MSITPIGSNAPAPREPGRSKVERTSAERKSASLGSGDAVKTRGLVSDIGARMAELEEVKEHVDERVGEVLEALRNGELLSSANIEQAAEAMLQGEDPEAIPLD
jgi:hypothetical protein